MREILLEIRRSDFRYAVRIDSFSIDGVLRELENHFKAGSYVAVADSRVTELYDLQPRIGGRAGWRFLSLEAGEENKTANAYIALCEKILSGGIDRKTVLAAIGGGVVGDMAGFAAATLLRGLPFAQVPTTLLAQVDSSVGGKTGLNMAGGKNLLGAFYQPELVLVAPAFLGTLPEREYLSGLAEVVKYGILGDGDFFDSLARSADMIARRDENTLSGIVEHCCRMKAAIVGADEKESDQRQLLNLGHTFGHALEALAGYDGGLLHGEAVAVGMAMASAFAVREGMLDSDAEKRLTDGLKRLGLPCRLGGALCPMKTERLEDALSRDKKAAEGGLTLVLPTAIGACRIVKGVPVKKVADFMRAFCEN